MAPDARRADVVASAIIAPLRQAGGRILTRVVALLARAPATHPPTWQELEHFNESWKARIQEMAVVIDPASRVMDLGCGKMWLREFLPNCTYIPVDYCDRGGQNIVCDFNQYQFPDCSVDCAFVSGCLEYLDDPNWFVGKIAGCSSRCVISYCTMEHYGNTSERLSRGWRNGLHAADLIDMFQRRGMVLSTRWLSTTGNTIFVFDQRDATRHA